VKPVLFLKCFKMVKAFCLICSSFDVLFDYFYMFIQYMQDETNHLFPQANGTKIMSTNQTMYTNTNKFFSFFLYLFLCYFCIFCYFLKFEQSRGEEEVFCIFSYILTRPERKSLQYPSVSMKRFLFERNLVPV
jgi:hypothetical protein